MRNQVEGGTNPSYFVALDQVLIPVITHQSRSKKRSENQSILTLYIYIYTHTYIYILVYVYIYIDPLFLDLAS